MNTALMPVERRQWLDASGVPLAGGQVWTYAAGTTTLQATYQDALGAALNTNPIILDSSGSATVWLGQQSYKIVVQDANGVTLSTTDNVSSVSLPELQGITTFAGLTITGDETVNGNLTVDGTLTAASIASTGSANFGGEVSAGSLAVSGNASVGGTLTMGTSSVTGNETVAGTLNVAGMATVEDLTVGGTEISALITSLIPAITAVSGALLITNIAVEGNWVVFTFGATSGTRVRVALGAGGGLLNGASIPLPDSGFSLTSMVASASIDRNAATPDNQISMWAVSVTAGVITVTSSDTEGHNFTPTAGWMACAWQQNY